MGWQVKFHPDVVHEDLPSIDQRICSQIFAAIEHRLAKGSPLHGKPLQKSLRGCRRLRMGDYRIVYKFYESKTILVVAIQHRSHVYNFARKRIEGLLPGV